MLGNYDAVIIDEAHEIEEYATSALGDDLRITGIKRLTTEVLNFAGKQDASDRDCGTSAVNDAVTFAWAALPDQERATMTLGWFAQNFEVFATLIESLRDMAKKIGQIEVDYMDDKVVGRRTLLATRASKYADTLSTPAPEIGRWGERHPRNPATHKTSRGKGRRTSGKAPSRLIHRTARRSQFGKTSTQWRLC